MGCNCGKKKTAPVARRGFAKPAAQLSADLKAQVPTRPKTWSGNREETK